MSGDLNRCIYIRRLIGKSENDNAKFTRSPALTASGTHAMHRSVNIPQPYSELRGPHVRSRIHPCDLRRTDEIDALGIFVPILKVYVMAYMNKTVFAEFAKY